MISCILISHGPLASAMTQSVEMVAGEAEDLYALGMEQGESTTHFRDRLEQILISCFRQGEVIVVSDLLLGAPFNAVSLLMEKYQVHHLTGMSSPMLLALLNARREGAGVEAICQRAIQTAKEQTIDVNEFLKGLRI